MTHHDDNLATFELQGAPPLPPATHSAHLLHNGAQIHYATFGSGPPVLLLHGGLGHSGNWAHQLPPLLHAGYQVILIDSRGHGRSTRDSQPYSYELMASDALAVLDTLNLPKAHLVGWSDGACISLVLAMQSPSRVASVFFFACNMDPTGTKEFHFTPTIRRCLNRHTKDYALLSPTPDQFDSFSQAVGLMMQSQPNYSSQDLSKIHLPVAIVQSPDDEFIKLEHAQYLAQSIPNSQLILLSNVTHFAPLQHPDQFNTTLLTFLQKIPL